MSEEYESSEQSDLTPEVENSESQPESGGAEQQEAAPETQPEEKPAPFHEHPRFRELIEQNKQAKQEAENYKQAIQRLQYDMESLRQQAAPKKEEPQDPFLADLEKVNPAYAKSLKTIYEKAAKADQIEQRLQQYENQQFAQKAYNHFDGLLASSKIEDPTDKEIYRLAVEAEVYRREMRGEKLGLKDLDAIFSGFHDKYSKALEERERKLTAKYVTSKKADQAPSGATGGGAAAPAIPKFSSIDSPEAIKWLADKMRESKKTL